MARADFPTAEQIARAIVMAAQMTEEDPEAIMSGFAFSRARNIALVALKEAFPTARAAALATCLKFAVPRQGSSIMLNTRKNHWWREDWIDEIVGALVAPEYGERAL